MAYTRSLREIPLTEEPHKSVLEALLPGPDSLDESPGESPSMDSPHEGVDWSMATPEQIAHIKICPECDAALGGLGKVCLMQNCKIGSTSKGIRR
jgi:hypothetical protein